MDIILSNSSDKPIYEQIASQIRAHILAGTLVSGEKLPSIRAYSDLEEAGFIETVQGKGCFVAAGNQGLLREEELRRMEALLAQAAALAETLGVTRADLHKALDLVAPETRE